MSKTLVLVPAHNEEDCILDAIKALQEQTLPVDKIVVVSDNCTDSTEDLALGAGATVFRTAGNTDKKAGGLNQALAYYLPKLKDEDYVVVTDADSTLDPEFLERGRPYIQQSRYGAVGGVFRADSAKGFVPHLQRNEYLRYARDVDRLQGKCLVVTGTAAIFRVGVLKQLSQARLDGTVPEGNKRGGIYDTTVLTEDNEISFALQHLGYKIISPVECGLTTETMITWRDLWNQRLRWKRGAIENCVQYGLTKVTWKYWGRQLLTMAGIIVTVLYLSTLVYGVSTGSVGFAPFWLAISGIFVLERIVTVSRAGWRTMVISATMYELVLDFFLQACHAKAYVDAAFKRKKQW